MFWALGFLILFMALLIPILAIVMDSPLTRNLLRSDPRRMDEIMERVQNLEDEIAQLGHSLEELRDETEFVHRLLKNPDRPERVIEPPPPGS